MTIYNNVGNNFPSAMKYIKTENKKTDTEENNNSVKNIKALDLNNDGKITSSEIQKSLFGSNTDENISSSDLGLYTAFISYNKSVSEKENGVKNKDGSYTKTGFDKSTGIKTTYTYNAKNQLISKEVNSNPKTKEEYQYNEDGSPLRTYTYKYNKDGSYTKYGINHNTGKETIRKYNAKNQLTSYSVTSEPKSKEEYQYNEDGSPLRTYTYKYNKDGSYTKYGINHNTGKETIRKYNTKNELTSYEVNSVRIENGEEVKRTYKYKYNSDGSYTKYGINHNTGKETTWEYNANKQLTGKVIKEGDNEKVLSNFKYYTDENGKEYKDYTVEYNYTNGVHTKSYITERKLEKSDDNYIVSSRNYQIIPKADGTFEERLIFTLNTDNVTDAKGKVHEGTYRTFYFYDENGNKIKEEFTTFYNKEEIEGKPIGTNSRFVKENKTITTFDPATGLKTSVITYSDKGITTTTFDKDGKTVKDTKTESFKENSYNNHNLKDVTGEDIIAEVEKYIGLNRRDGSYSIFGTNGSACATFATYVLYQLGFDLTSITSRTTPSIRNQAEREGRYTSAADIFERVKNGEPIENIIKAGNIYTEVRESGSHTTIIKSAAYDSEKNEIILEVIGYESNAYTGVKTGKYVITQNENGEITRNNVVNKDIGFSDFVSTPEEIAKRNKKLGLYQE